MTKDSRTLIRSAFEQAKASGRLDWYRMTVAVLKNRILGLTEGRFKEPDHGATSFQEFVRMHGDILEFDESTKPPVAILKGVSTEPDSEFHPARERIRADLWRAVLDFSSRKRYVWDGEHGVARVDDGEVTGPELPTITVEQFNQWKETFAKGVDDDAHDDQLREWTARPLPSNYLPYHLKHRWHAFLKAEVHKHLATWFEAQKLSPPSNLREVPADSVSLVPTEILRKELIACLRSMTAEELERVQVPSTALIRRKLKGGRGA